MRHPLKSAITFKLLNAKEIPHQETNIMAFTKKK